MRTSFSSSPIKFSHSENKDRKEIYLFDFARLGRTRRAKRTLFSFLPSPAQGGLGK